jgi:hypothetical protein
MSFLPRVNTRPLSAMALDAAACNSDKLLAQKEKKQTFLDKESQRLLSPTSREASKSHWNLGMLLQREQSSRTLDVKIGTEEGNKRIRCNSLEKQQLNRGASFFPEQSHMVSDYHISPMDRQRTGSLERNDAIYSEMKMRAAMASSMSGTASTHIKSSSPPKLNGLIGLTQPEQLQRKRTQAKRQVQKNNFPT